MPKNLGNLMRQAQKMQEKMAEMQKDLASRTVEASSGGGMVTAVVSGAQEIISLKIDQTVVDPKDVEMLQDLVMAAVNEGMRRSKQMMADEMSSLTSGLGMNIPGLF